MMMAYILYRLHIIVEPCTYFSLL